MEVDGPFKCLDEGAFQASQFLISICASFNSLTLIMLRMAFSSSHRGVYTDTGCPWVCQARLS